MTPAEIEQAKFSASWLNSIATAIAAGGALAPCFAAITGTLPATTGPEAVIGLILVCTLLSLILHSIGRRILAEI
jgi:hypothetical protein